MVFCLFVVEGCFFFFGGFLDVLFDGWVCDEYKGLGLFVCFGGCRCGGLDVVVYYIYGYW